MVYFILGFIVGAIVVAVLFNNKHHRDVGKMFAEIDRHVDMAADISSNSWRKIRRKVVGK